MSRLTVLRLLCAVVACAVVGGCSVVEEIVRGDEPVVLVTVAEKEALGYERPEGVPNGEVQARAMAHREEIFAVVKPRVEEVLGREVEMVGIDARYPYNSVNVLYRTVSEPVVASDVFVGLEADGGLKPSASISGLTPEHDFPLENRTVLGLYYMAYREEVAAMVDYLRQTYPQYAAYPEGFSRSNNGERPDISFAFHNTFEGEPPYNANIKEAEAAIYAAYVEQPVRTDAQWRELFETHASGVQFHVMVPLVLKDAEVAPTEAMVREVGDDIRANPLFADYDSWTITVNGGLMMRDGEEFHEEYFIMAETAWPEWDVTHLIDGYNY